MWKNANYSREWYAKNSKKKYATNCAYKQKNREWLKNYKRSLKCARCPESDPLCLDFHHIADNKILCVSECVNRSWSIERLKTEIAKCIVLCANCHRKEHYASVTQTAECLTCNEDVAGATPASSSNLFPDLVHR